MGLIKAEKPAIGALRTVQDFGDFGGRLPQTRIPEGGSLTNLTLEKEYEELLTPILEKFDFRIKDDVAKSETETDTREYTLLFGDHIKRLVLQIPDEILENPQNSYFNELVIVRETFKDYLESAPDEFDKSTLYIFCTLPKFSPYKQLLDIQWPKRGLNVKRSELTKIIEASKTPERLREFVKEHFDLPEWVEALEALNALRNQLSNIKVALDIIQRAEHKIHWDQYSELIIEKMMTDVDAMAGLVSAKLERARAGFELATEKPFQDAVSCYDKYILPNYEDIVREFLAEVEKISQIAEANKKVMEARQMRTKVTYNYLKPLVDFAEEAELYVEALTQAAKECIRSIS